MSDPHARDVLNSAATNLGWDRAALETKARCTTSNPPRGTSLSKSNSECSLCLTEFHSTDSPIKTEIDGKTVEIHDFDCTKEKRKRAKRCDECGIYMADPPSRLCPGCQAYKEHTQC
jgi:hypothetical protein